MVHASDTGNENLIRQFYNAFQQKDYGTMQSMYHDEATFSDAVFVGLNAAEVRAMWQMLLTAGRDLRVSFANVNARGSSGSCNWEAFYTFSRTGNKVHNIIAATFEFKDGKIISHQDRFDFWRWSRQAFGVTGLLLGWTPFFHNKVKMTAREGLEKFIRKQGA